MRATLTLAAIAAVAFSVCAVGMTHSLPYAAEIDEPPFVEPAIRIAATGELNPGWFGHPGATVIYPLALLFRLSAWDSPAPDLQAHFKARSADFYSLGRWLSVAYLVGAIPLVYLTGRAAFGSTVGLIGAWLTSICPIIVAHAQMIRSDSAAVFFGLLSLWLAVRASQRPSHARVALAGLAVGLAVASRYFMLALVPALVGAVWAVASRQRGQRATLASLVLGLTCAGLGFALASPYALLDRSALARSLVAEAEPTHLGADGLTPFGNLAWYVSQAVPADLTWPVAVLAGVGICIALWRRRAPQVLLLLYLATHVVLISVSALHWHRWTIQTLPLLALFSGYAIQAIASTTPRPRLVAALGVAAASIQLTSQLFVYDWQQAQPSASVLARNWIVRNLPAERMGMVAEWYGPALDNTPFRPVVRFTLAEQGLADYARQKYTYLVATSPIYDRYFAEPTRYPHEVAFYRELFSRGELLSQFQATAPPWEVALWLAGRECNCWLQPTHGAPVIRIYRLGEG